MSASFPKSESTTSLLKSSSAARKPTHLPERAAESRRGHHQQHQHHHRPAALHSSSSSSKAEESFLSAECEISARRPLCHPSLIGSPDSGNDAATRGKCKSLSHHSQLPDSPEQNGVKEHCRSSKPTHRHHHRRKQHRDDLPPAAAAPPEAEHPRRSHTHIRTLPRVPSLSDSNDDRAPLCEPRDHKGVSVAISGAQQQSVPVFLLPGGALQQVLPPLPEIKCCFFCIRYKCTHYPQFTVWTGQGELGYACRGQRMMCGGVREERQKRMQK
ncbi:hypothetical protein KUCAC02_028004 [Chaenocephalus aceratus]|uniref:Uncharacterized protein n=1 Tax=Chaenocephalus aceratus TaxID=36190 RepID=A0ACB9X2A7_CHAAC|nr:hypothetical protein KUCAC02_028004 [Chaenocephalus aceratus]